MSLVGQVFSNRYRIEREIARGGMAEVYLAIDESLNRQVALKALFPEFAREPSFVERFRREAQAAANLNHPNIVGIYDWGQEAGTYFIVMEYVEGRSLRDLIRSEGPIEPGRAADITAEIASALAFAHRSGVVHRDVKPGNVLITPQGHVKVTDFGIARAGASDGLTQTGSVMGTATYFSPEQAQGLAVDGRSDVYSLGVVLYELVCGGVPFVADSPVSVAYKHVREEPVPPSQRNTDVPPALEQIIMSALAKDPDQRYQSADDMRADLLRFRRGRPLAAAPVTAIMAEMPTTTVANPGLPAYAATTTIAAPPRVPPDTNGYVPEPRRRRHPALFTLLVLLVLGALVAAILFATSKLGPSQVTVSVPNVVGKTYPQAKNILANQHLVAENRPVNSAKPVGSVVSMDPTAGSDVKKNSTVVLSVSVGVGTAPVPDVTGLTTNDAKKKLTNAKFQVQVDPAESSSTVNPGSVIRTEPAAGGVVTVGSIVHIIPSKGVAIPNVVNQPQQTAFAALTQAGLVPRIKTEPSNSVAAGSVTRTDPPFGTNNVPAGTNIDMFVSTGPSQVSVPPVVGFTVSKAQSTLAAANLQNSVVFQATNTQGNDGKVLAQDPPAGTLVNPQTPVLLTIGEFTPNTTTTAASHGTTTTGP
jgi:serine/threonine-protein kinase